MLFYFSNNKKEHMSEWKKGFIILVFVGVAMLISSAILAKPKKSDSLDDDAKPLYKSADILGMNNFNPPSEEDKLNVIPKANNTTLIVFISIIILIIIALNGFLSI
jgi:uncharacterized protein YpmS